MDWLKRRRVLLGSSLAKPIAPLELRELWRTTIPGHKANVFICDASSGSLFASDGRGSTDFLHRVSLSKKSVSVFPYLLKGEAGVAPLLPFNLDR
jgi:hypothetical protein